MVAIVVAARVAGEEKMTTMPPAEVAEGSMPRTARGGEEGMDIRPTLLLLIAVLSNATQFVLYDSCFCPSAVHV